MYVLKIYKPLNEKVSSEFFKGNKGHCTHYIIVTLVLILIRQPFPGKQGYGVPCVADRLPKQKKRVATPSSLCIIEVRSIYKGEKLPFLI